MGLNANEWLELQGLLGRARSGSLDWSSEQRMRYLLSKQNPGAATMNMDDLVKLGFFLLGMYVLAKLLK